MIEELLKIADIQGLTGREPERARPIHWLIDLDANGRPLQFSPTTALSKKAGRSAMTESRGKRLSTPLNYHLQVVNNEVVRTNANQHSWFPNFLVGPASEIFPRGIDGTQSVRDEKRRRTWALLFDAHKDERLCNNKALTAVINFLKARPRFDQIPFPIDDSEERLKAIDAIAKGELLSFRVAGHVLCQDSTIRSWWSERCDHSRSEVCRLLPTGLDSYQDGEGPLPHFHPTIFSGIALFSYDKAPFKSFGLGQWTTRLRLETTEKMAAALNWLMNDESSSLSFGEYKAVFWATTDDRAIPVDFAQLLDTRDPLAVHDFFFGPWSGSERELDTTKFHAALLRKSGKGRFAVNSWHTDTLGMGRRHISMWFNALRVPSQQSRESGSVSIRELAECTVRKSKETRPLPGTYHSAENTASQVNFLACR